MADRSGYIGRAPGDSSIIVARQTHSPTGVQTDFTFASGYTVGYIDAYLNGSRLINAEDYTATDGTTVGLTSAANNGDILELVAYKAFNLANVAESTGNFSVGNNLTVTDDLTVSGDTTSIVNITGTAGTFTNLTVTDQFTGNATGTAATFTKITAIDQFSGNISGIAATFTGPVTIGGTLTYEDATNVDSVGLVTARTGVRVTAGGMVVTAGVSTFAAALDVNGELDVDGQTDLDNLVVAGVSTFAAVDINGSVLTLDADGDTTITADTDDQIDIAFGGNDRLTLSTGLIDLKNDGSQSAIRLYCESSNAHYAALQAPAHSAFSGNITLTLPATTDTLVARTTTDTLTNKTLTSPNISTPTMTGGVGIADSIFHTGDDNTQIRFPAADTFTVETAGSEALRITSGGLVGINTTPGTLFELKGESGKEADITFNRQPVQGTNDGVIGQLLFENATDSVAQISVKRESAADDAYFQFATQATGGGLTEKLRITSAGDVNIGGNFTETSHQLNISDSTKPGLCLHTGTTQRADFSATSGITSIRSFSNSPFSINIGGSGETEAFRITGDGDVNIGPSANANGHGLLTLSKSASAAFNALTIQQGNTGFNAGDGLHIGIDAGVNAYFKLYENRDFYFTTGASNTEKLRITSAGKVLVGFTTERSNFYNISTINPKVQIEGTTYSDSALSITTNGANSSRQPYSILLLSRSRGLDLNSNTLLANDDVIGAVDFQGSDGTQFVSAAAIECVVNGTPGADDMPGALTFRTTPDNASTPTEKLRLTKDGKLILSGTQRTTPFIAGDGGMCIEQNYDGNLIALSIRNKSTHEDAATSMSFSLNRSSGGDQDFTAGEIKTVKEAEWTSTSSTVDSAMVFSTMLNGTMAQKLSISSAGRADFVGRVASSEWFQSNRTTGTDSAFYATLNDVEKLNIKADGSASFAAGAFAIANDGDITTNIRGHGHIELDSTGSFSSPKIKLFSNTGNATFAGNIVLSTSGSGIDFSATADGSGNGINELFDDYEEGYWTPTVNSGSNPSSTLVVYRARYTKIGRQVTIGCELKWTGGDTGAFRLQGLPFNTATSGTGSGQSGAGMNAAGSLTFNNLNITGLNCLTPYVYSNLIYFYYTAATDGASWTEIKGNEVGGNTNGGNLLFTIEYFT